MGIKYVYKSLSLYSAQFNEPHKDFLRFHYYLIDKKLYVGKKLMIVRLTNKNNSKHIFKIFQRFLLKGWGKSCLFCIGFICLVI